MRCAVNALEAVARRPIDLGWAALAEGRWLVARARFEESLAGVESPEALEGLSWAAWWLDDADVVFAARERAYGLYRKQGQPAAAARMATWLGVDELDSAAPGRWRAAGCGVRAASSIRSSRDRITVGSPSTRAISPTRAATRTPRASSVAAPRSWDGASMCPIWRCSASRSRADEPDRLAELDRGLLDFATRANVGEPEGPVEYRYEYLLVVGKRA